NRSGDLAQGRLRILRRAVSLFGFHLASIDLRQNSDVHERVVNELFDATGGHYRELSEDARIALLLAEISTPRPLASPHLTYSKETAGELLILSTAASSQQRYGRAAVPHYVISKASGASDILEVAVLLKEVGLLRPRDE